jgi:hypothetical protein
MVQTGTVSCVQGRYGDPRKDSTAEDSGRRMDWILCHTCFFSAVD